MTDSSHELPRDTSVRGRVLDARLHLLDRQIVDPDEVPLATVDDLELDGVEPGDRPDPDAPVRVRALLSGPLLMTRIFGGRVRRDRQDEVPWRDVSDLDAVVHVVKPADEYEASWTERWVRERIIARIPGGRHAPE
ncbi:hypothetical protein [Gryllotalpicola ginsengisoli]|uniref:hypothetical protein n=1 Tax=Gryllotalpicola ginsengisoli TaxID=444608 RepID=UPI0003B3DD51|nr:hypothetical protein [Gryllotalpicola ginsengisoli]